MEINQFDKEAIISLQNNMANSLIWGAAADKRTEEQKFEDELKMGMVQINGKQEMVNIHPKTMKAYKTGSWYSLVKPIEEIQYEKFDRWCRGMDF